MGGFFLRIVTVGPDTPPTWAAFGILWLVSRLYLVVVLLRRYFYSVGLLSRYRSSLPVISVGNVTTGGTGKTPVVDYLVKSLERRGLRTAIVSRGYGGTFNGDVGVVSSGDNLLRMTASECGDEPFLLAQRNPSCSVFIARRRSLGVKAAESAGADVVVLDDGFQHMAVERDLDIVLLDASIPFGTGHVLPAGLLREPVSALSRADLIVLTRATEEPAPHLAVSVPVVSSRHSLDDKLYSLDGDAYNLSDLEGKRVAAFAGIATPEAFFQALKDKGLTLSCCLSLSDHQDYTPEIIDRLREACHNHQLILTTEKDAVKLRPESLPIPCLRVPLSIEFFDSATLEGLIDKILKGDKDGLE